MGTLEQSRVLNASPETFARWLAALNLRIRDFKIKHPRQIFNIDQTHVEARRRLMEARTTVVGVKVMRKPELVISTIGFGAATCTAAITVLTPGLAAPMFLFVEGETKRYAFAKANLDGVTTTVPLSSRQNGYAMVVRRSPAVLTREVPDTWCEQLAAFSMQYYPRKANLVSSDGTSVHVRLRTAYTTSG